MIIIDMQIPKSCMDCRFNATGCAAMGRRFDHPLIYPDSEDDHELWEQRMPWCPLQELVQCKDCRHWIGGGIDDKDNFIPPRCTLFNEPQTANWFCPAGQRKEEET